MKTSIEKIISKLDLKSHPEGGFYRETYRSTREFEINDLEKSYQGKRNYSTCIYFMLTSENFSAFHKIKQDEIWHFYIGSPILLHMISPEGDYSQQKIGNDFEKDEVPQFVVPGGFWFASEVAQPNTFSLVGCTVSPGFDFKDFELKSEKDLIRLFPDHKSVIKRLTNI